SLVSTIVAGNANAAAPDILSTGTVTVNYSAVGSPAGFTPTGANNLPFGATLNLGPLADNGGPTRTPALLPGSAAPPAGSTPAGLAADQRGTGFLRQSGPTADIGAFEAQSGAPKVAQVVSVAANGGAPQRSMVTAVTVTFSTLVAFAGAPAAAFRLTRTGPGAPAGDVALSVDLSASTATQTVARLTFGSSPTENGSLVAGHYQLTRLGR